MGVAGHGTHTVVMEGQWRGRAGTGKLPNRPCRHLRHLEEYLSGALNSGTWVVTRVGNAKTQSAALFLVEG